MSKKLTRRQFLAVSGVSTLGGLLAACAPQVVTQVVKETQVVKGKSVV